MFKVAIIIDLRWIIRRVWDEETEERESTELAANSRRGSRIDEDPLVLRALVRAKRGDGSEAGEALIKTHSSRFSAGRFLSRDTGSRRRARHVALHARVRRVINANFLIKISVGNRINVKRARSAVGPLRPYESDNARDGEQREEVGTRR